MCSFCERIKIRGSSSWTTFPVFYEVFFLCFLFFDHKVAYIPAKFSRRSFRCLCAFHDFCRSVCNGNGLLCNVRCASSTVIRCRGNSVNRLCNIGNRCYQFFGSCTEIRHQIVDFRGIHVIIICHLLKFIKTLHNICIHKIQQTVGIFGQISYCIIHVFRHSLNICHGIFGLFCQYPDFLCNNCKSLSCLARALPQWMHSVQADWSVR